MADHAIDGAELQPSNIAIPYLAAFVVLVVIVAFAYIFGEEIFFTWIHRTLPPWVDRIHHPINTLATLVGGIVAVAFSLKPPTKGGSVDRARSLPSRNLFALGQFLAPSGKVPVKVLMGMIYAIVYVALGLAAIGTWAFGGTAIPPDVKSLATSFIGMVAPIVIGYFS